MFANKIKILFLIVLLLLGGMIYGSFTQIKSQTGDIAVVAKKTNEANFGTKVDGSIVPVSYDGTDLKQFTISQPLPDIWMYLKESSLENNNYNKISLSEETKNILYKHWLIVLNHKYLNEIAEVSSDINYQTEDNILVQSSIDTENLLLKMPIRSDKNSRNFSTEEANQLLILLRDKAEVVTQEIKTQTPTN